MIYDLVTVRNAEHTTFTVLFSFFIQPYTVMLNLKTLFPGFKPLHTLVL